MKAKKLYKHRFIHIMQTLIFSCGICFAPPILYRLFSEYKGAKLTGPEKLTSFEHIGNHESEKFGQARSDQQDFLNFCRSVKATFGISQFRLVRQGDAHDLFFVENRAREVTVGLQLVQTENPTDTEDEQLKITFRADCGIAILKTQIEKLIRCRPGKTVKILNSDDSFMTEEDLGRLLRTGEPLRIELYEADPPAPKPPRKRHYFHPVSSF